MRLASSSERRWSRISSTTAAVANPMIAKLASATPTASQPAGKADSETSIVGSGMIDTAPIAVK